MNDRYAQTAMNSLSFNSGKIENRTVFGPSGTKFCETLPQPTHLRVLTKALEKLTERAGFDLPSLCKVLNNLILQLNSNDSKDLNSLVDLLFLHDFYYLVMRFEGNSVIAVYRIMVSQPLKSKFSRWQNASKNNYSLKRLRHTSIGDISVCLAKCYITRSNGFSVRRQVL